MKLVTVFTPTYNRAYILTELYNSLLLQTCKDFEWLIVDDGSSDNTQEVVKNWIEEDAIIIRYFYQENGGKMRAHNRGVQECTTNLFFCVDSDDILIPDAIEKIIKIWGKNNSKKIAGIVGYKAPASDKTIPSNKFQTNKDEVTLRELYESGYKGETSLIYRVDVLAKNPFPEIPGEKFITEAYIYNKIDNNYKLLLLKHSLTLFRYLDDGYTRNTLSLYKHNPIGWSLYYNQQTKYSSSLKSSILSTLNYIAFSLISNKDNIIRASTNPLLTFLLIPFGHLLKIKKTMSYKKLNL